MKQYTCVLYVCIEELADTTISYFMKIEKQLRKNKPTVNGQINKLHSDTHGSLGDIA